MMIYPPSILITIEKNEQYVSQKTPEDIKFEEDKYGEQHPIYPFELELPVSTFKTIWSTLGIDYDEDGEEDICFCGSISAEKMIKSLKNLIPELCYKDAKEYQCEECGWFVYEESIDERYLNHIIEKLKIISYEALMRGEKIIWD